MATANRNQHWVPQFYLRRFASPETRDTNRPQIWAFPIEKGDEFRVNPRNVAAQRDLYANCPPEVDERLTDLESMLGGFWQRLAEGRYPINDGFKKGISLFIATLYLRHPAALDRNRRFRQSLASAIEAAPTDKNGQTAIRSAEIGGRNYEIDPADLELLRNESEKEIETSWGERILDMSGEVAQYLLTRPWTVLVRDEPAFITTDHPVTLLHPTKCDAPICDPGTHIYLPLSPTQMVVINQFPERADELIGIAKDDEAVFNYFVFRSAYRYMFSSFDPVFAMDQIVRVSDAARDEHKRTTRAAINARDLKVGRNERCPCGSGRKFKKCCGG